MVLIYQIRSSVFSLQMYGVRFDMKDGASTSWHALYHTELK